MVVDFRSSVFNLCKKLKKDPRIDNVRTTIHNLHVIKNDEDEILKPGHGDLAYIAENQYAQFLGYLYTDDSVEEINKQNPFYATNLDEEERFYIEEAHETILFFIESCMRELSEKYPKSSLLIHPYSQYREHVKKSDAESLLKNEDIQECVESFKKGRVYQKLLNNDTLLIMEKVDQSMLKQLAARLNKQFSEDFDTVSEETEKFMIRINAGVPLEIPDVLLAYCSYCYALKSSLQIAIQTIFDAIIDATMLVMNNDNIIDLINHRNDIVYEKYVVLIDEMVIGMGNGTGSISLLTCDVPNGTHIKDFGIITSLSMSLLSEFGSSTQITMVTVDEELNRIHRYTDTILNSNLGKMPVVYNVNLMDNMEKTKKIKEEGENRRSSKTNEDEKT